MKLHRAFTFAAIAMLVVYCILTFQGCSPRPLTREEIDARKAACIELGGSPIEMARAFGSDRISVVAVSCYWSLDNKFIERFKPGDKKP